MKCKACDSFINSAWESCLVCGEPRVDEELTAVLESHGDTCVANDRKAIHLEEAVRLYRERGWVQIYSSFIKTSFFLVKDNSVEVPESNIAKLTQSELDSLKGLSREELLTMHEAKMIFGGTISDAEKISK